MTAMTKPAYRRILLKLSGEALMGEEPFGIDAKVLDRMAHEIKELVELGVQVGLVIGGGNLFRGEGLAKAGMNRGRRPYGDVGDSDERLGDARRIASGICERTLNVSN